ncbi:hypothetical protein CPT76_09260 [Paenibacillus sp. AR247]|nr:hypothetical protein CPT76_09260 [Paenibacillus sp. AR247]
MLKPGWEDTVVAEQISLSPPAAKTNLASALFLEALRMQIQIIISMPIFLKTKEFIHNQLR